MFRINNVSSKFIRLFIIALIIGTKSPKTNRQGKPSQVSRHSRARSGGGATMAMARHGLLLLGRQRLTWKQQLRCPQSGTG
jgi:hypothetical protein